MTEQTFQCVLNPAAGKAESALYFDIVTDGHFWRTSTLLSACAVFAEHDTGTVFQYTADPQIESDEFEILSRLIETIGAFLSGHPEPIPLYTFNGTSFLLPYIEKKCKAYDLKDPLPNFQHTDLYLLFRPLYYFLRLPSRRMSDYLAFSGDAAGNAADLPNLMKLMPCLDLLQGNVSLTDVQTDAGHVYFSCSMPEAVPRRISWQYDPFYLIAEENTVRISAKLFDGKLKRFYPDYKEYYYLETEGYAVHKSVASFLPKERLLAAAPETCYTWIACSDDFLRDPEKVSSYLKTAFSYFRTVLHM